MHRFFVDPARPERIEGEEHAHLSRVLRLTTGETVELLNGEALFLAELCEIGKEYAMARIVKELPTREANMRVTLYVGMLKGEKMDWVVQKLTELGAHALVPVLMRHSVAQGFRGERAARIAKEAQKQCGRARGMTVAEPMDFRGAAIRLAAHALPLAAYEGGGDAFSIPLAARDVGIMIGPEGGFSQEEILTLADAGVRRISLGPRILRAETAAIAAIAGAMACAGEWV